jgi:hypothetical protein
VAEAGRQQQSFRQHLAEDRRLCVLTLLAGAPGQAAPDRVLYAALPGCGHRCSHDMLRNDLMWLAEMQLIELDLASWSARLLLRGEEVATGRAAAYGVKSPSDGD